MSISPVLITGGGHYLRQQKKWTPISARSATLGNASVAEEKSGGVYVDANALIYRVEAIQPYLAIAAPLWDALRAATHEVITSELSLLETTIKPLQLGNITLQSLFETILYNTKGFACIPITRHILDVAAQIRATHGLKTPDAIHAATALIEGCTLFVTNDPVFRRLPTLTVAVLSEIAATP